GPWRRCWPGWSWCSSCWRWGIRRAEPSVRDVVEQLRDRAAQVAAVDDPVDEAVVEQELAALEPLGEADAHGLGDHLGAGEADQGLGLGQDDVPERREAGGDAPHRGVREDADEEPAGLAEPA